MDVRARLGGGIFNHRGWLAGLGVKIVACYRNQHATAKERKEKTVNRCSFCCFHKGLKGWKKFMVSQQDTGRGA
ncbi:MAG: hypothetical protein ABS32_06650 [Verrucomicrobia subdivision 6 bacterium BACL9 MAG-120820-bin42]|uniref:Uncharacterized protein n=1 Tax=Verrucomicrobia subdivision 6 bacterium BACL9 MAG-120820-bin42 TaxID=1655634 RepID=A0A0R2XBN6_9BACT|nr:MAG: hypothetical protein ABS32_06650 [Verrucomicrobia subdivision 6 bacterium BACL9 MAG-120820-bin42]